MISATQYARALHEAISETNPKDHDQVLDNFVKVLSEQGDIGRYAEIEAEYKKMSAQAEGIEDVTLITAREMPNAESLIKDLNELAGKRLNVTTEVDTSLIGGMLIRAGDTLIDASVKKQLEDLRTSLTNNHE
jgi:F-type H+-transporting ATPase subunit delta